MSKNNTLKKASIKQLEQELNARKSTKIAELKLEVSKLERQINELSPKTVGVIETLPTKKITRLKKSMARGRIVGKKSLADLLVDIGENAPETRKINEYKTALEAGGWKSSSPTPYYVVAAALAAQTKKRVFRRVSEGSYELVK
jgi:hypothetical protein